MNKNSLYAVITGDVVDSSKIEHEHRNLLLDTLKDSFHRANALYSNTDEPVTFNIFRGDSFQGLITDIAFALAASLVIRAMLRKAQPQSSSVSWDARTAIGIGTIDFLPDQVSEGDGEAYRRSGPYLDKMKADQRLSVITPWEEINREMLAETALLDAVIAKWSPQQAEIVLDLLDKKSRKTIGEEYGISQAAVHYRVKGSGWFAIEQLLERYQYVIQQQLTHD